MANSRPFDLWMVINCSPGRRGAGVRRGVEGAPPRPAGMSAVRRRWAASLSMRANKAATSWWSVAAVRQAGPAQGAPGAFDPAPGVGAAAVGDGFAQSGGDMGQPGLPVGREAAPALRVGE